MEEKNIKQNNNIVIYSILTTIFALITLISLIIVYYFHPVTNNIDNNVNSNSLFTSTISSQAYSSINSSEDLNTSKVLLEVPSMGSEPANIQLSYPNNTGIVATKNDQTVSVKFKLNSSELNVNFISSYKLQDCLDATKLTNSVNLNGDYYRVLEKSDSTFNYYYVGYKNSKYTLMNGGKVEPTCYEKNYISNKTYGTSWYFSYKVSKQEDSTVTSVFDNIFKSTETLNRLVIYFRGDFKNNREYGYYVGTDSNDYYYFIQPLDFSLENDSNTKVTQFKNISNQTDVEDFSNVYIIKKDSITDSSILSTNNINKQFVIDGKAATVQEGMPSTYKFYTVNSISLK